MTGNLESFLNSFAHSALDSTKETGMKNRVIETQDVYFDIERAS